MWKGRWRGVEKTCEWCRKKGIKAGQYHAGLDAEERELTHKQFLNDEAYLGRFKIKKDVLDKRIYM